jgi:hypothetical protein
MTNQIPETISAVLSILGKVTPSLGIRARNSAVPRGKQAAIGTIFDVASAFRAVQ